MSKPIVFFSHSSLDKEVIITIKDLIDQATGGVLDIFMSSDGQSIPFGTNWVHRVEEGLCDSEIMFVFITENSIRSGWIYFEAGYAYSKGIKVIPVGLGVDISDLRPPLNLLQGFNISSGDSLNNCITIINQEFEYQFEESLTDTNYLKIMSCLPSKNRNGVFIEDIVSYAEYELLSEYYREDGSKEEYDIDQLFECILSYIQESNLQYSIDDHKESKTKIVVAEGVRINYKKSGQQQKNYEDRAKISFRLSMLDFEKSFCFLQKVLSKSGDTSKPYLKMHFNDGIRCIKKEEDASSLLAAFPDEFMPKKNHVGLYTYNPTGLVFTVFDNNSSKIGRLVYEAEYVITIVFDNKTNNAQDIIQLFQKLYDIGFLRREE